MRLRLNLKIIAAALLAALSASAQLVRAANPIVQGVGLCDPQVRVFDNQVYLYATHDAVPDSKTFIMHDWWVWNSTDLLNWKQVSTLTPQETYFKKPSSECWATDAISHNGKYYFYFSRGRDEIGVVVGDTPSGPWHDPIGKPLIAAGSTPTLARDPGILQEPDGTTYIVFGCWRYYLAKLNNDMVSLAETPRFLPMDRAMGPYGPGRTDDKPFLHERNGIYYLSWGCYYARSTNIYGPYKYQDCFIKQDRVEPVFQRALTYDRHGSFFELYNQWYFICNDQSWPGTSPHYRDSVISYVHFRDNGDIDPIYLNRLGVGRYDTATPIPAANYFALDRGRQAESPDGGFEVRDLQSGSTLDYPHVMNVPKTMIVTLRGASAPGCTVEVQSIDGGAALGTCTIPPTGGWTTYTDVPCTLNNEAGTCNLRLLVKGGGGELLRLKTISFSDNVRLPH